MARRNAKEQEEIREDGLLDPLYLRTFQEDLFRFMSLAFY